jgi:ATP-dependent RNA helicase RhlE
VQHGSRRERIHGNRSQAQRTEALAGFKSGRYRVLVATDIAARGIDIDALGHVVNFDVPAVPDDYIHRVGRTARAEATGDAFTFVAPEEEEDLRRIEKAVGKRLPRVTVPDFNYKAKPAAKLEVPIGQRIAEIRARKGEERARAKINAERRAGAGARPAPSSGPRRVQAGRVAARSAPARRQHDAAGGAERPDSGTASSHPGGGARASRAAAARRSRTPWRRRPGACIKAGRRFNRRRRSGPPIPRQAQNALGDHVALDLARAAHDRFGARVEVVAQAGASCRRRAGRRSSSRLPAGAGRSRCRGLSRASSPARDGRCGGCASGCGSPSASEARRR